MRQLDKTDAELRDSGSAAMREIVDHQGKLRAVQDGLVVVGQPLVWPPMSSSTAGASRSASDDPEADQSAKRVRRSFVWPVRPLHLPSSSTVGAPPTNKENRLPDRFALALSYARYGLRF